MRKVFFFPKTLDKLLFYGILNLYGCMLEKYMTANTLFKEDFHEIQEVSRGFARHADDHIGYELYRKRERC